ncbi:hypothetical protein [Streptomyces sp. ISL-12]|uniref:hypothetical protein n=1 Tax=Streptomyces sp. ISL-12 TaxID=2819177 RepID=UPI0035ABAFAD
MVGSCPRNAARPDSDVDLVLFTTDESRYLSSDAWATGLGLGRLSGASRGERSQSAATPRHPAWKSRWASARRAGQRWIRLTLGHIVSLLTSARQSDGGGRPRESPFSQKIR